MQIENFFICCFTCICLQYYVKLSLSLEIVLGGLK